MRRPRARLGLCLPARTGPLSQVSSHGSWRESCLNELASDPRRKQRNAFSHLDLLMSHTQLPSCLLHFFLPWEEASGVCVCV